MRAEMQAVEQVASDVTLKDGSVIHVRALRPNDDRLLIRVFNNCSPWTIYQRFLTALPELTPSMARYLADVDNYRRVALIAETDSEPVGVARYAPTNEPDSVELGLVIIDEWQNRGLGRILLRKILNAAEENGFDRFCAYLLGGNRRMLRLLASEGNIQESKTEAGSTMVSLRSRRSCTG